MLVRHVILLLSVPALSMAHELTPNSLQLTFPGLPGIIRLQNSSNETGCTTSATVSVSGDAVTVSPATSTYTTPPASFESFFVTPVKPGNATITVNWTVTVPSANCSGSGSPRTQVQVVAASALPPNSFSLGPNDGVSVEQVTFAFMGQSPALSRWGRAVADVPRLRIASGMPRGYLNIYSQSGWVVQNWPLDSNESLLKSPAPPGMADSFYFQLLDPSVTPSTMNSTPLQVVYARQPLIQSQIVSPALSIFPVRQARVAIQGAGEEPVVRAGNPPPARAVDFTVRAGETFSHILPNQVNVETATNQCFPMSIANSLQYLEARYRIDVPADHVAGVKGDNTLVGRLDTLANRPVTNRRSGSGTPHRAMLSGKFKYLADNNLGNKLVHQHQGRGFGSQPLAAGDFTANGVTSKDAGAAVTWEWLCDQIKAGEDVEMTYTFDAGGGHAIRVFGCGKTLGRPWIKYLHDADQDSDTAGLETVTAFVGDTDADGSLNMAPDEEIRFAFSESVTDEVKNALFGPPQTSGNKLVSAASFVGSLLVPGGLTTAFGLFAEAVLGPNARAAASEPRADAAAVYVNGRPAPIFYAGPTQINFQVPEETEAGEASVVLVVNGRASDLVTIPIGAAAPGIFQLDASIAGAGRGVIQNQDYSLNLPASSPLGKPATPGSAIIVYMTGLGRMNPALATGAIAPASPLSEAVATVTATIGGRPASVVFAGATPGFTGLHQVNVIVPGGLPAGDADLIVTAGGTPSNTVKVAIESN